MYRGTEDVGQLVGFQAKGRPRRAELETSDRRCLKGSLSKLKYRLTRISRSTYTGTQ